MLKSSLHSVGQNHSTILSARNAAVADNGTIFMAIFSWYCFPNLRNHAKFELIAVQGHPRSSILVPIENAHATSY